MHSVTHCSSRNYQLHPEVEEEKQSIDAIDEKRIEVVKEGDKSSDSLLKVKREQNYSEWYYEVIKEADLAENSVVRGCMAIKPNGYAIWENIQRQLDDRFKANGVQNAYFPMFIPLSFFQREASHVDGFAKECAVVTHYRLKTDEEKGIIPDPSASLEEPLVVRPTSETIIGEHFSQWIRSYRDLPVRINQWANVVRWEHQTRMFLRTTEFLWQEGHTAHETAEEAEQQALKIAKLYEDFIERNLAVPVITGEKSPSERFAGAEKTYCFEAMMQDGKALQAGTSHYLGQKFSKAFDIKFFDNKNAQQYAYTTSWGLTTRLIGSIIMVHSDDDGLRQPPKIASKQIVIIPSIPKAKFKEDVYAYANKICALFNGIFYEGQFVRSFIDDRHITPGKKFWDAVVKGIPIRMEIGPREIESNTVYVSRRDFPHRQKISIKVDDQITNFVVDTLNQIQDTYFKQALDYRDKNVRSDILDFSSLKEYFLSEETSKGFVLAKWCGDPETEDMLKEINVTIRCIPFKQTGTMGPCILTGKPSKLDIILAKSY